MKGEGVPQCEGRTAAPSKQKASTALQDIELEGAGDRTRTGDVQLGKPGDANGGGA